MLTHYCVAKNQPRMVAREIGAGGASAVFTFLDATGIPSRDSGHMDRAAFSFQDGDHFTSKWSWYRDGKDQWMERFATSGSDGAPASRRFAPSPALRREATPAGRGA